MVILVTERLKLRGFEPDDWMDLQEYVAQKDVMKYDHEWPSSDEECKGIAEYFSKGEGFWAVCLKQSGKMIGHIVSKQKAPEELLTWSIGFGFNPLFHRKGYATESCQRILKHVFEELGAHRVESSCHPDNIPAWKLLERLSMRREAHHIKGGFLRKTSDGKPIWWDSYVYAILDEEWKRLQGK